MVITIITHMVTIPPLYPLVNIQKTIENHHVQWENPRTKWLFSIAILI